jgi:hypothetical protein
MEYSAFVILGMFAVAQGVMAFVIVCLLLLMSSLNPSG